MRPPFAGREEIESAYRWLAREARCVTGNGRAPETGEEGCVRCGVERGVVLFILRETGIEQFTRGNLLGAQQPREFGGGTEGKGKAGHEKLLCRSL